MAKRISITSGRARRAIKMGELASQVGSSYLWNQLRRPFLSAPARERELLETHIRNAQRIVAPRRGARRFARDPIERAADELRDYLRADS